MSKKLKLILIIISTITFIVFFAFIYSKENTTIVSPDKILFQKKEIIKSEEIKKTTKQNSKPITYENTENITIIAGEEKINLSIPANTFFYDALIQAQNAEAMTFSGKNYPGLGFFITNIGKLNAGDGKYLLYYINGKEASVGVSSYSPKDGDVIEWKLK